MSVEWTEEDTVECYKQGWVPFQLVTGRVLIQALDDPDGVARDHGFAPFMGKRFPGRNRDDQALAFVRKQAAKGSDLARRALQLVKDNPEPPQARDAKPNYRKATNILKKLSQADLTFLADQAGFDLDHYKTKDRLVAGLLIVLRVQRP